MNIYRWQGEQVPLEAKILGAGGLVPLLAAVAFALGTPQPFGWSLARAGVEYAAMILSFLGGIHWGFACSALARDPLQTDAPRILGLSVLPPLAGWVAVFLPDRSGAVVLAMVFIAVLLLDRSVRRLGWGPVWWMRLRATLTAGIAVMLLLLAILSPPG